MEKISLTPHHVFHHFFFTHFNLHDKTSKRQITKWEKNVSKRQKKLNSVRLKSASDILKSFDMEIAINHWTPVYVPYFTRSFYLNYKLDFFNTHFITQRLINYGNLILMLKLILYFWDVDLLIIIIGRHVKTCIINSVILYYPSINTLVRGVLINKPSSAAAILITN